jgi:hypothetical protein
MRMRKVGWWKTVAAQYILGVIAVSDGWMASKPKFRQPCVLVIRRLTHSPSALGCKCPKDWLIAGAGYPAYPAFPSLTCWLWETRPGSVWRHRLWWNYFCFGVSQLLPFRDDPNILTFTPMLRCQFDRFNEPFWWNVLPLLTSHVGTDVIYIYIYIYISIYIYTHTHTRAHTHIAKSVSKADVKSFWDYVLSFKVLIEPVYKSRVFPCTLNLYVRIAVCFSTSRRLFACFSKPVVCVFYSLSVIYDLSITFDR